jgi:CO/xanthine dehydrogenase FAD-binding subunit
LEEALLLIKEHGSELMISGGGTMTMMLINNGYALPKVVLGLRKLGLDGVYVNGSLKIGAMTTMSQILTEDVGNMLHEAARNIGGWAIRNMATVGGNLMAPQPAGDFAVALLALGAKVTLTSLDGVRSVSLEEFYASESRIKDGELITEIHVAKPTGKTVYVKHARRDANAPAIVTVAAHLQIHDDAITEAHIALNGVGMTPIRAIEAENTLKGQVLRTQIIEQAAEAAAEECDPFTDAVASEWYRRKMVNVFVKRGLESLM